MYSNFEYYTPTKVIFGKGAEMQAGEQIARTGAKKVLIHYGGKSAARSGLLDRVKASLDEAGIAYAELVGISETVDCLLACFDLDRSAITAHGDAPFRCVQQPPRDPGGLAFSARSQHYEKSSRNYQYCRSPNSSFHAVSPFNIRIHNGMISIFSYIIIRQQRQRIAFHFININAP